MLKIVILIVFIYNLVTTVSDPTIQNMIICIGLLLIGIGLVLSTGKRVLRLVLKYVGIAFVIGYILIQTGVVTIWKKKYI